MSFLSSVLTWILCVFGAPSVDCHEGIANGHCQTPMIPTAAPIDEPESDNLPWGVVVDISNGF